jgi:hypothetical protein
MDGLVRDLYQDPRFAAIVERDLREGQHRNPTERLDYFTRWLLSDVTARLADPRRRTDLLQVARLLESEPAMLGVSAHLLVVARTPPFPC